MAKVTEKDVHRIAKLARLHIDEDAAPALAHDLSSILGYVRVLTEVPVDAISDEVTMETLRHDQEQPSMSREQLLAAAPQQNGDGFVVPRVVG